jgi:ubiquinone/menaquinone biosynthesis C-methylase UbiE
MKIAEAEGRDPTDVLDELWQGSPCSEWMGRFILSHFEEGFTVCEIGAGIGRYARHLVDQASRLYLCDYSSYACSLLRKYFSDEDKVTVFQSTDNRLHQVPDASIDLVFSIAVFMHIEIEGLIRYLRETYRVLRSGRKAVFEYASTTTPEGYAFFKHNLPKDGSQSIFRYHHPEEIRRLIKDVGFRIESETVEQTDGYPEKIIVELVKP